MNAPALNVRAVVPERGVRVDLTVPAGQVIALVGANGAGKSTALALASGTLRPSEGEVWVAGRRVAGPGTWVPPHRRHISLCAQEPLLLPHLDAADNVAFGPRALGAGRARARQVALARLEEVGAAHLAGRRPRELSGGQQQRVAIARALAPEPRLVLLDEPLAALDVDAAAELRQVLRRALRQAGRTAVVVTHSLLDVLAVADAVVVMEDGRVVEEGPTAQVLTRPRSGFAARLAGVNLLLGEHVGDGAVRVGGDVVHGPADDGPAGGPAAAAFAPRTVAVHRTAPGGSPRNVLAVRVTGLEQQGALVRVRGETASGNRLAADVTPASLAALALAVGEEVLFVVKAAEVEVYPA
ncbi:ATP-binding cassette domain-containing protein [Georgenia sp. 311]|uniref:ATP-binding cassette domain-containing protein n=1 Tax=Georgenia wutianyii TaxID=2585135 RepID=A0ABX5VLL8_9MICO|nr:MULTISPECIES: ATP-binding cassette domain-containing protein [Georgenia]QDB78218.1 ATP-binding cassette domain-containing protein [Georgenia wutianyii]TNC16883.1 ATP-binding cassette domain-containing protein [Georgenia sp. 311]